MKKLKHILALIGIIVLVLMYIITLFYSFFDNSTSLIFFKLSLALTVFIPTILWILSLFIKISNKKKDNDFSKKDENNFSKKYSDKKD